MKTSVSEYNSPYSERLYDTLNREIHSLPNDDWIQFLLDHREEMRDKATLVELNEETMYRYRYRINDYLLEVHSLIQGADQAFRILNRLHSDLDFDITITSCWIPDREQLNSYRSRYQTNITKQKRLLT